MADWIQRFDTLPLSERNVAIKANAEYLMSVFRDRVCSGASLLGPLAAENQGDDDKGEYTFLVQLKPLRDSLAAEYGLTTAAELMLLDALVLSYHQYIRAASTLHAYTAYEKRYNYETLVRYVQAYMVRANELFLRNLEALRQLKTVPFTIKIDQAGQVNVGEQQVNLAAQASDQGRCLKTPSG